MISLSKTTGTNNDFRSLVDLLDEDLNGRYGTLQSGYNKYNSLDSIKNVIVAYINNVPAGCGCFKEFDTSTIEIKRMFVKPEHRGTGLANHILCELGKWGAELGYKLSILETGIKQVEAIRFYQKNNYKQIDNFGQYAGNTNSVCFNKFLL
jgi:putative acetyltransferase